MSHIPLVSVVVPAYNVVSFLDDCVGSILAQNYTSLEVILVDDGSTDGSGALCDRYAASDPRVSVIHKPNGGLSSARNAGVAAATGDYLMFVDGDDWLDPVAVGRCIDSLGAYDDQRCVVAFAYMREYPGNPLPRHIWDGDRLFEGDDYCYHFYRRLFGPVGEDLGHPEAIHSLESCWGKLYPIAAVRAGRYFDVKEVGSSEDGLFNIYALSECVRAVYLDECFYHYRKQTVSLSTIYRPELQKQWDRLFNEFENAINVFGLDDSFGLAVSNRIALSILGIGLNELSDHDVTDRTRISRVASWICSKRYKKAAVSFDVLSLPFAWRFLIWAARSGNAPVVYMGLRAIALLKGRR